jgi:geranylgeranyl diphosphate synthase type II
MSIANHLENYLAYLEKNPFLGSPDNLYQPMNYIMNLGGKRIRPVLCLIGAESCGGNADEALNVAQAIEIFHNFSLVHDDIMDRADQRRGLPTVHKKWNEPTAILAGDNLLVKAYESILAYSGPNKNEILTLFSRTATEVCEGQQDDMDFAERNEVSEADYLHMIQNKTAVLLGCSLASGALTAGAKADVVYKMYQFAIALGMSFQLMDDYLDSFGTSNKVGKVIGGDIMEGKKTWLYIKSLEHDASATNQWFDELKGTSRAEAVINGWKSWGLDSMILEKSTEYENNAKVLMQELSDLGINTEGLNELMLFLKDRTH